MKYIVAVSGGIDSVVLLHKLTHDSPHELIVAHVNHGIREDSYEDAELVKKLAEQYGLPYVETKLHLGPKASEETARDQRYAWLHEVKQQYGATHIATAHHQDDVIETMIINLVRGTGWRGLCALTEQTDIIRPLLAISKAEIISYALDNNLEWREDSTNENVTYLRNYIRLRYVQRMNVDDRHQWVTLYHSQVRLRDEIDAETSSLLPDIRTTHGYSRYKLIMAGRDVFAQLIQSALQTRLERTTIDQLWHFVCTARPEKQFVQAGINFRATTRDLIVSTSDIC